MSRFWVVVTLLLTVLFASRCANREVTEPMREAVICTSPEAARQNAADIQQAAEVWRTQNVRAHGNGFALYVGGSDRKHGGLVHEAQVPDRWTGDALAERAAWTMSDRERLLDGARRGFPVRRALLGSTVGSEKVIGVWPSADSRGEPWQIAATAVIHEVVICDPSSSADAECGLETLLFAYDRWLSAGPGSGSTFELYRTGTSLSTARRIFALNVPAGSDAQRLTFLFSARNELDEIAEALQKDGEKGSAIAEAVTVGLVALSQKQGVKRLTILSDLQQTSPDGPFNFASARVPSGDEFVQWLTSAGLLRDARGVDVLVCGAHARVPDGHPALSPRSFQQIPVTWSAGFAAMHPKSQRIYSSCDAAAFTGGAQ